jgi:hypothetical protein
MVRPKPRHGASAQRIVERKERGRWLAEHCAVVGANPLAGEAEFLGVLGPNVHEALPVAQRRLDRLGQPRAIGFGNGHAVLHDAQLRGRAFLFGHRLVGAAQLALHPEADEALLLQRCQRGTE